MASEAKKIGNRKYREDFSTDNSSTENTILSEALKQACDNRKFEIDIYWKRATYFWTLIASAFAAYFLIQSAKIETGFERQLFAFIVSCSGFVFTYAWLNVNRGSKKWQENWENHVGMLEDKITGPLYKTVLQRLPETNFLEKHLFSPSNVSVSKVNLVVCAFTLGVWSILVFISAEFSCENQINWRKISTLVLTLSCCYLISSTAITHEGNNHHYGLQRTAKLNQP